MSAMSRSWSDSGAPAFCTSTNASDKLKPWGPGGTAWPKPGSSIGEILRACRGMGWTRAIRGRGQLTRVPVETRLGSGSESFRVADVLSRSLSGKARKRVDATLNRNMSSMSPPRGSVFHAPRVRGGEAHPPLSADRVHGPARHPKIHVPELVRHRVRDAAPRPTAAECGMRAFTRDRRRYEPPRVAGVGFFEASKRAKLETFDVPAPFFRTRLRQTAGVFKICAAADRARPHAGATTHGTRGPGFGAAASRPVAIRAEARRLAERRGGCLPSSSARRSSYIGTRPIALRSEDEPRPDEPNPESRVGRWATRPRSSRSWRSV